MADHALQRGPVTVHYETHGGGPGTPLLLTHGFSASSTMWLPNLSRIGAGRSVITWDIRGHGRTAVPPDDSHFTQDASVADMAAILDDAGVERAVIGGLSLGGFLSLAFHAVHPDRVAALILCDTGPGYRKDSGRQGWNDYALAQAERLDSQGLAAVGDSPETRGQQQDPASLARAARGILTQHDSTVIDSLERIAVPTLVVVGEHDTPFLAAADYMAARVPGAVKAVIAGAGHASNMDAPETFDRVVVDFLERLDG
jgi:pimeloyl-ACP methyl ester carboxylesterase